MDARLAQVRALVDERWRVARERRDQNEALTQRIEALERHLAADLLPIRARHNSAVSGLEEQILQETNAASAARRELESRQKELAKADVKALRGKRHSEFLEKAIDAQKICQEEVWKEMMEDLKLLQDEDKSSRTHDVRVQQEKEETLRQLQDQLAQLNGAIATRKAENDKTLRALEASKRRKRVLEHELEQLERENKRLKSDLAKQRRGAKVLTAAKQLPAVVEDGLDAILRELDEIRR